ncbi:hypothetical protein acsn021_32680 [Anaerocolumna cellulosilytica]|uniref:Uncharacterized protein n=1 Tax=Anaerocolumna cellulosilytica TaxID=433286 RepID=A0A6S6R2Z7_9FIRM|nr:DUF3888 domain-containing protein [Anaerocolumna cellulosilytica]MBB5196599.1 hypothetical protein [Anaerocolumna cellulosilytica]BCJ95699.1 hypothetical protein acsn021_32680 [Anaerocolumna cellulosilytica]
MKKRCILIATISTLIVVVLTINNPYVNTTAKQIEEESQDILYQDVIITALAPTIDKAIDEYYKNVLTYLPGYDSSFIKILNIDRPNGNRTWHFIIDIEVEPFIGPHIAVGKDRISLDLSYPGIPKILKFEHIEDYPLPERYKDLYLH